MKLFAVAAVLFAAACGSSASPTEAQTIGFERWSPAQPSAHDVLLAARGDVVVLAKRFSRDGGATWAPLDSRIGELKGVAIRGDQLVVFGTTSKLARWDLASGQLTPVTGAPSYLGERTWRVDTNGKALAFDAIENAIAVETAGAWTTGKLPQPSATEVRPYIKDVESNGSTILTVSAWGVHRSLDGGATWTFVTSAPDARDILVLGDRRFVVINNGAAMVFDANGSAAGTAPALDVAANEATVCEDGAIVWRARVTYDLGATWRNLIAGGDLSMQANRATCGNGRYWVLALSDVWGYRFVRFDGLDAPGVLAGNWDALGDQTWTAGGPPIVRAADGTFLVGGLSLAPGATEWTLRETPARSWASGDTLFGLQKPTFYTSVDGGANWVAAPATGLTVEDPEAFARGPDGTLYVSEYAGGSEADVDTWRSRVWKSSDGGTSWSVAYEGVATRGSDDEIVGGAYRFVGIAPDGAWIATNALSRDGGTTWQGTEVEGDRGLAHLTRNGTLITGYANETQWRVYDDGGLGSLRATYKIEVEGNAVPANQLRSVAFDEEGYAYVARGNPFVQIWKSDRPLDRDERE